MCPFVVAYRPLVFTSLVLSTGESSWKLGLPRRPGTIPRCSARLLPIYRVRHARISPRSNREPVIVPLISRLTPRNRNSFRGQALSIAFIVCRDRYGRAHRVRCTLLAAATQSPPSLIAFDPSKILENQRSPRRLSRSVIRYEILNEYSNIGILYTCVIPHWRVV